jgi:chemotaxis protein MotB
MKMERSLTSTRALRFGLFGGLTVLAAVMGGCAANSSEVDTIRTLTDRNQTLLQENQSLEAANRSLQAAMAARDKSISELKGLTAQLTAENQLLRGELAKFDERLAGLKFGPLDVETDAALRDLAGQFPDLIEYDAARGMIRFKSDLTFASGSDQVTAAGKASLDALARVLLAPAALKYDVKVLGHTDSQPISSSTAKRFPTNVHLSAGRAISVRSEVVRMGVAPERFEVAGRGEFDPFVPNTQSGNTPQNRRVEIYLMRGTRTSAPPAVPEKAATKPAVTPAPKAPTKNEDVIK